MSDVKDLVARIEGAFTAVKEKAKEQQQLELQHHQERQKLLKEYEKLQPTIVDIARPRLEALAKRAGERAKVTPSVTESRRSVRFEFRSAKASITSGSTSFRFDGMPAQDCSPTHQINVQYARMIGSPPTPRAR